MKQSPCGLGRDWLPAVFWMPFPRYDPLPFPRSHSEGYPRPVVRIQRAAVLRPTAPSKEPPTAAGHGSPPVRITPSLLLPRAGAGRYALVDWIPVLLSRSWSDRKGFDRIRPRGSRARGRTAFGAACRRGLQAPGVRGVQAAFSFSRMNSARKMSLSISESSFPLSF